MADIALRTIAVMFYSGDYKGSAPKNIKGLKAGDNALDTSCSTLWEFNGERWMRKAFMGGGKISLQAGTSIHSMLKGAQKPLWMEVYSGDDRRVPSDIRFGARNLVIRHRMGLAPMLTATYFDSKLRQWFNVEPTSGSIMTSADGEWSVWIDYLSKITPFASIVNVWDIGSQGIKELPDNGGFSPEEDEESSSSASPGISSPADELSKDVVDKLLRIANVLNVDDNGSITVVVDGEERTVATKSRVLMTASSLENGKLRLPSPPAYIVNAAGDVLYMTSKYDTVTNTYILDFAGLDVTGLWSVYYL